MTYLFKSARRPLRRWPLAAALSLVIALPAQADAVTDWNALAASGPVVAPRFGGPQQQARMLAIMSIAVHDALNTIDPRYDTYSALPGAAAGASPDAAVAAAARTALLAMFDALPPTTPAETANRAVAVVAINAAYDTAIGPGAPSAAEAAGIAAGEAAADAIIAARYAIGSGGTLVPSDGSDSPNAPPYALPPGLGVHQPTPAPEFPAMTVPTLTGWSQVLPFAVRGSSQFRSPPGAILKVGGVRYALEYNLVKVVGDARVRGAHPDSALSDIPRFWAGGGLEWNANVRAAVAARGLDRWQHARLLALVNIAVSDTHINNMQSKYHYNFWRPVTAIRWADDGNPLTRSDAFWRPFLQTPPYPDYPCASTGLTGAVTQTLRRFFASDAVGFTRTVNTPAVPLPAPFVELPAKTITRGYHSLTQAENEQAMGRVYAGIHFPEGCFAGLRMGNRVADWVYMRMLRP